MAVYNKKSATEDESHQKISSFFLGPRAENYDYFKSNIIAILEEHQDSRLDYFPRDGVRSLESLCFHPVFCGNLDELNKLRGSEIYHRRSSGVACFSNF